jgi:hypothetical protein
MKSWECIKATGSTPSEVRYSITRFANLSKSTREVLLDKYYILYWSSQYLVDQVEEGNGTITHQGVVFQVYYHPLVSLGAIKRLDKTQQVAISFRVPKLITGVSPVALILG